MDTSCCLDVCFLAQGSNNVFTNTATPDLQGDNALRLGILALPFLEILDANVFSEPLCQHRARDIPPTKHEAFTPNAWRIVLCRNTMYASNLYCMQRPSINMDQVSKEHACTAFIIPKSAKQSKLCSSLDVDHITSSTDRPRPPHP